MVKPSDFVHLHVHSEYSILDGAAPIDKLVQQVANLGQKAVAITDHGNLHGAYAFFKACQKLRDTKTPVKPIIGIEAYVTPGTARNDPERVFYGSENQRKNDVSARGTYTHATIWAQNNKGLANLFEAATIASADSVFARYPRWDIDLYQRFHEGLIITSGCPSSEIQTRLRLNQFDEALKQAAKLQDIFGKENFFIELMDHGIEFEKKTMQGLLEISKKLNAPLVATNDLHYVTPDDTTTQDALLCINSKATLNDPDRFKFDGSGYYVKSAEEMAELFKELPEAITNTRLIAERCNIDFKTTDLNIPGREKVVDHMPIYPLPEGITPAQEMRKQVREGLLRRFKTTSFSDVPKEILDQAKYEINVIEQKGYPSYFLVVADFINWAKQNNIRIGPGRGSAAGAVIAWAMGITELNPLQHGLIFERFLNPERESMPDIDVDIEDRYREKVVDYVTEKYGRDRVAHIVTFGRILAKNALRDAARILGKPVAMGDKLAKAYPDPVQGKNLPIAKLFDETNERYNDGAAFRELIKDKDSEEAEVYNIAKKIEGLVRGWGVHAAGVIISDVPIVQVAPLFTRHEDNAVVTQFDYYNCEELGLVKMDFLGLRNLGVISDCLHHIKTIRGEDVIMEELPLDDKKAFDLLARGDTLGCFQLDGNGMRTLLKQMKPDCLNDISACNALYRPGPMGMGSHTKYAKRKNGLEPNKPIHPELGKALEPILNETYGLIVYQEQVQRAAEILAGYSLGEGDELRRAMGKKKRDVLAKQFDRFSGGMKERGYNDPAIKAIWDTLDSFADYAFNKAHSASYALIGYWEAYLKSHYPVEFMAALLTSESNNKDKLALYLNECKRMGIVVKVPDINKSGAEFVPVEGEILFGLRSIQNVGEAVVTRILETRKTHGEFTDLNDFLNSVPTQVVNKRVVESLIKAGAFDSFNIPRRALFFATEGSLEKVAKRKAKEEQGLNDLFAMMDLDTNLNQVEISGELAEWPKNVVLNFEKELLGLYVSDHPLSDWQKQIDKYSTHILSAVVSGIEEVEDKDEITIVGIVSSVDKRISKAGRPWARFNIETIDGASVQVASFGKAYEKISSLLNEENLVVVTTLVIDKRIDDTLSFRLKDMRSIEKKTENTETLSLRLINPSPELYKKIEEIVKNYPGSCNVKLYIKSENGKKIKECKAKVDKNQDLMAELCGILPKQDIR